MDNKKIAYSVLELAIVSQGQTMKQTLNNSLAFAKESEAMYDMSDRIKSARLLIIR